MDKFCTGLNKILEIISLSLISKVKELSINLDK